MSVLLISASLFGVSAWSAKAAETALQAQPVIALLDSVKARDQKRFQTAFSERLQAEFEKQGWDKVLQQYEAAFKEAFGEYEVEQFSFGFSGDNEKGIVSVSYKGKSVTALGVVNERGAWKMNER